jgi:hypothetical protein
VQVVYVAIVEVYNFFVKDKLAVLDMSEEDFQIKALKRMSAQEKLHAAILLYYSARQLKAAWIRRQHEDWTTEQVEQAVKEAFTNART